MKCKSDWMLARSYARPYAVAVTMTKKAYFVTAIASLQSHPEGLFCVVQDLLQNPVTVEEDKHTGTCCDRTAIYFAG